jgi:sugar lactone lactonase YvrE
LYKPGRAISEIATRAQALTAAAISKAPSARLVCNPEAAIGESPVGIGETIIWTDPVTSRLLRFADSKVEAKTLSRPVWSLAELPGGGLAGTFDDGFCTLDPASGALEAGPAAPLDPGSRFNDMTVDAAGGLWAGAMHRGVLAGKGAIFHASALDTAPACVARGLGVPNGMGFSADGRTLFVIDTLTRTLLSYPADSGTLGEPSIVTDFLDLPGKPDGMTIAPDGSLWVAMWGGGLVVQIARDGALLRTLSIPAPHISSLCFAGSSLFVTTSRMRLSPEQITRHPGSGGLFSIDLENVR